MEPIKKFVLPDRTGGRPDAHIVLSELLISANERQFIIDASNVVRTTPSYLDQVVKHVLQDCNVAQVVFLNLDTVYELYVRDSVSRRQIDSVRVCFRHD